jgi:hypothetical protein
MVRAIFQANDSKIQNSWSAFIAAISNGKELGDGRSYSYQTRRCKNGSEGSARRNFYRVLMIFTKRLGA